MQGLPVTIRLLDPPLHEFLPHADNELRDLAAKIGTTLEHLKQVRASLFEVNPMLGHRGSRLGISFPEIYQAQARAIIEAACELRKQGVKAMPEIMLPLIGERREFDILAAQIREVAAAVFKERGIKVPYTIGTMIEVPRACVVADQIGEVAEFFSFGTNDLTQMTYGISRDDSGKFLPDYIRTGVYKKDPFAELDPVGVGELMRIGIERGRKANKKLKIGICGEHGGDPASVKLCHRLGLDYVSCSPYRIPVARLGSGAGGDRGVAEEGRVQGRVAREDGRLSRCIFFRGPGSPARPSCGRSLRRRLSWCRRLVCRCVSVRSSRPASPGRSSASFRCGWSP